MKLKRFLIIIGIMLFLGIIGVWIYFSFIIEQKIPILTYHNILSDEDYQKSEDFFDTSVSTFKKQMKFLKDNNFKTISLDEYYCWKQGECKLPRKSVLITFDDGFKSVYKYALPILKENDQKAVSFVLWSYVERTTNGSLVNEEHLQYLTVDDIKKSQEEYSNLEYASHTFAMHDLERHGKRTEEEIQLDIDLVAKYSDTKYIAYPNGYSDEMYKDMLKKNDYKLAFKFGPYANSSKSDDDFEIVRTVAGDAWPYWKFVIKMLIRY